MSIKKSVGNVKGFTLVELLIVVAIIGVLASQGVPAYRRMIQKSRKGEAQNMLGNIASAESAFFSEYGAYGDNLARMGSSLEGTPDQYNYTAGVNITNICGAKAANAFIPTAASVPALNNNPGYQTLLTVGAINYGNVMGRAMSATAGVPMTTCYIGPTTFPVAATLNRFTASATGYIQGGTVAQRANCNNALANCDQWSIDETKSLINQVDGVN